MITTTERVHRMKVVNFKVIKAYIMIMAIFVIVLV